MSAGIMAGRVIPPVWMRYCPECFREDRKENRELYWRRLHQMTGVDVCPKHNVFLENSALNRTSVVLRQGYEVPIPSLVDTCVHPTDAASSEHQIMHQLATIGQELIDGIWPVLGLEHLRNRYLTLLSRKGFIGPGGNVRLRDLCREFRLKYSDRLLDEAGCGLYGDLRSNWIGRLIHKPSRAQSPIRHLVMLNFLGIGLKEFFTQEEPAEIKREPQCNCPNAICVGFKTPCASHVRKAYTRKSKDFFDFYECGLCKCLFSKHKSAGSAKENLLIRDYGSLWKSKMSEMWKDTKLSLKEIAKVLKLHKRTIKRQAYQCGLPFPRKAKRLVTLRGLVFKADKTRKIERLRNKWLNILKVNPAAGVNAIRNDYPSLYAALYSHDHKWLMDHRPPRHKSRRGTGKTWETRDLMASLKLLRLLAALEQADQLPLRVTKTRLVSAIGARSWLRKLPQRMPILNSLLKNVTENLVAATCRRVRHVERTFKEQRIQLSQHQLIRLSGINRALKCDLAISKSVHRALATMRAKPNGTLKADELFETFHSRFDNLNYAKLCEDLSL